MADLVDNKNGTVRCVSLQCLLQIWMCGGTLENIPCSHVGHVFRSRSPFGAPDFNNYLAVNVGRVAAVWMDDYRQYAKDAIAVSHYALYSFYREERQRQRGGRARDWGRGREREREREGGKKKREMEDGEREERERQMRERWKRENLLVRWCLDPSQPLGIKSGLKERGKLVS